MLPWFFSGVLGVLGAAAELLFLPPEVATLLVGLEFLVVLSLLLFVMVYLVGLFFDDGS